MQTEFRDTETLLLSSAPRTLPAADPTPPCTKPAAVRTHLPSLMMTAPCMSVSVRPNAPSRHTSHQSQRAAATTPPPLRLHASDSQPRRCNLPHPPL
eukprot:CAMPEP_0196662030 /NCGR_PEP_ID=MMETSP1086-20130531/46908_1 /TAXON_ID=77921 /ORGANISM="Cyanoptyche  gloeocystis , Strain SAG4.97" /LENGTH=96 /DNA_ID=CAMNT_0041997213 /DNA_START=333 /DNA_END=620 /DNA_ORIENTATION=+